MITPKVHILILNWNGKDILYDCVNSIFNGITITIDMIEDNPNIIRLFALRSFLSLCFTQRTTRLIFLIPYRNFQRKNDLPFLKIFHS